MQVILNLKKHFLVKRKDEERNKMVYFIIIKKLFEIKKGVSNREIA